MKILIDGDGCPVIEETIRTGQKYNLKIILISDTSHIFEYENVEVIMVSKGADSADFYLVNRIEEGDIVVTQDYGLAAMCLAKGAKPINQNGFEYNNNNIDAMLLRRHISKNIRRHGGKVGGIKKRKKADDISFLNGLEKLICRELGKI